MMDKYKLQELRDLPIEGVAERLGLTVRKHMALCPFHADRNPSLYLKGSSFRCFSCGAHGGVIDLAMHVLGKGFREACEWLNLSLTLPQGEGTQGGGNNPTPNTYHPTPNTLFDASRYERYFERPWLSDVARRFLFDERRLDERVISWCRVNSWRDREGVNWLQTPYYDVDGRLIGIQRRNLVKGALPRFRFPYGSRCGIYNLPVLALLGSGDELWITEGCSDCWAMLSSGRKAIAIPSATLLSPRDKELLSALSTQLSTEFHMYPDKDAPGERLFLQLKEILPELVHHELPVGCKDFSDYYVQLKSR